MLNGGDIAIANILFLEIFTLQKYIKILIKTTPSVAAFGGNKITCKKI
jgi:hypothetical protein